MIGRVGERGDAGAIKEVGGAAEQSLSRCWAVTRGPMVLVWRW